MVVGAVQEDYGRAAGESNGGLETNGYESRVVAKQQQPRQGEEEEGTWYEEEIDDDLKLCYALNSVLHRGASKYQDIALIDTKHFGKVTCAVLRRHLGLGHGTIHTHTSLRYASSPSTLSLILSSICCAVRTNGWSDA